jgi:uncharacterized protein (TIGR00730 family)
MKSICIFCGSSDDVHPAYLEGARHMGKTLAKRGIRLVYGGGKTGLMGAVAQGALDAGGEVIGVIIPSMNTPGLAQENLARMEVTPSMHARKARMHELAEGFIALPGGFGTFDELFETLTWAQIGEHRKPIGALNLRNYFDPLLAMIAHAEKEGFIFPEHRKNLLWDTEPDALLDKMARFRPSEDAVRRWMRQDA